MSFHTVVLISDKIGKAVNISYYLKVDLVIGTYILQPNLFYSAACKHKITSEYVYSQ